MLVLCIHIDTLYSSCLLTRILYEGRHYTNQSIYIFILKKGLCFSVTFFYILFILHLCFLTLILLSFFWILWATWSAQYCSCKKSQKILPITAFIQVGSPHPVARSLGTCNQEKRRMQACKHTRQFTGTLYSNHRV